MAISTGVFTTRAAADQAVSKLEAAGIIQSQISLVMTEAGRGKHFGLKESSKTDEGIAAGAGLGGLAGVIAGIVLSAGALAIPGLNLIVTGAVVSGLAGLGAGAVTGGLIGGLIGSGIPEHEAKILEKEIQAGNVLLAVQTNDNQQKKIVDGILHDAEVRRSAA